MEKMTQAFGRIGRGKKIHFAYTESDSWVSGCHNYAFDYIGKPISHLIDKVDFMGSNELDDERRAVMALQAKRPQVKDSDICDWCFAGRYL